MKYEDHPTSDASKASSDVTDQSSTDLTISDSLQLGDVVRTKDALEDAMVAYPACSLPDDPPICEPSEVNKKWKNFETVTAEHPEDSEEELKSPTENVTYNSTPLLAKSTSNENIVGVDRTPSPEMEILGDELELKSVFEKDNVLERLYLYDAGPPELCERPDDSLYNEGPLEQGEKPDDSDPAYREKDVEELIESFEANKMYVVDQCSNKQSDVLASFCGSIAECVREGSSETYSLSPGDMESTTLGDSICSGLEDTTNSDVAEGQLNEGQLSAGQFSEGQLSEGQFSRWQSVKVRVFAKVQLGLQFEMNAYENPCENNVSSSCFGDANDPSNQYTDNSKNDNEQVASCTGDSYDVTKASESNANKGRMSTGTDVKDVPQSASDSRMPSYLTSSAGGYVVLALVLTLLILILDLSPAVAVMLVSIVSVICFNFDFSFSVLPSDATGLNVGNN